MDEIWKDIVGYEGKYYISNFGRVMNSNGLIMKPMICSNGYQSACLWKNNRQQKLLIHRLVAIAFIDNPLSLSDVNHKDEDKSNNHADNLEWCTHLYNMNYGNIRKKISASNKGRILTPEHRAKCASASGKRWMHTNKQERLIRKEEIPSFLISGWVIGRNKESCLKK